VQILKGQPLEPIPIQKKVKIIQMGKITEIMYIEKPNVNGFTVRKISKDEYVDKLTGEVFEYTSHSEDRSQNKESLRKTFKKIREIINTNFEGNKNELAFTITYAKNIRDTKRLYKDFQNFMDRLRYKYPNVDYMSVVEPQERGAWHCHVLLRFNDLDKIYIPNKEVEELWGNGFVKVKAIRSDVDNLGAYLSAYLGDVELNARNYKDIRPGTPFSHSNVKVVEVDGKTKRFIKGGRLHLYPAGMNIYRCSRGIKQPIEEHMSYADAKKIVGADTPNYSSKIKILDDENNFVNAITYEHYNPKRKK